MVDAAGAVSPGSLPVLVGGPRDDGAVTIDRVAAYAAVDALAMWSDWKSFEIAAPHAPLVPGVYQMRKRDGLIVYVGWLVSAGARVSADVFRSTAAARAP